RAASGEPPRSRDAGAPRSRASRRLGAPRPTSASSRRLVHRDADPHDLVVVQLEGQPEAPDVRPAPAIGAQLEVANDLLCAAVDVDQLDPARAELGPD